MTIPKQTLILGIGNILLGDEGIGICVIEYLQAQQLPNTVECIDGGTAGADLLDLLCNRQKVIIVDAIDADAAPGTMLRFGLKDLLAAKRPQLSLHDLDIPQTLEMTRLLNCPPCEVIFIGIQPQSITCTMGLTPALKARIPDIAATVAALALL